MKKQYFILFALAVLVSFSRLLPHPDNFAPMTAIALFVGFFLGKSSKSFIYPIIMVIISDALISIVKGTNYFYEGIEIVYLCYALIAIIGMKFQQNTSLVSIIKYSLAGSILFFLVTNFAYFLSGITYPLTSQGLMDCFTAAIPFFRNSLVGDVFYSVILFSAYNFIIEKKLFVITEN